jgi:uncharacterized protein
MFDRPIYRRTFLERLGIGSLGAIAAGGLKALADDGAPPVPLGAHRVWDAHVHLHSGAASPEESTARLLRCADRLGIERLIVSLGTLRGNDPPPKDFQRQNDETLRAIRYAPDRVLGFVYLNPKHGPESQQEMNRCVRDGPMVGIKLLTAIRCNDPLLDPIARRAQELKVPILQHTFLHVDKTLPGESSPADIVELAARHPDVIFLCGHTGADWERGVRTIRAAKNVLADICGSDPTAGMVEMAVRELGAERVVYGSDAPGRSFASQLAKVYGTDLPPAVKGLILGGNIRRVLGPVLTAKGIKA